MSYKMNTEQENMLRNIGIVDFVTIEKIGRAHV